METKLLQKALEAAETYAYEELLRYSESLTGDEIFDPAEEEAKEEVYIKAYNARLVKLGNLCDIDVTPYLKEV